LKHTVEELTAMLERTSEDKDFVRAMLAKALQSEKKTQTSSNVVVVVYKAANSPCR